MYNITAPLSKPLALVDISFSLEIRFSAPSSRRTNFITMIMTFLVSKWIELSAQKSYSSVVACR